MPAQFEDLDFPGYEGAEVPAGYVATTLGAESFQNDPYTFVRSLDGYVRADGTVFDFDNLSPNGAADNLIEEDTIFRVLLRIVRG